MRIRQITDSSEWDTTLLSHPQAHPLQTWGWGEVKKAAGWKAVRLAGFNDNNTLHAAAQLLIRSVPHTPFSMLYIPRGPVIQPDDREGMAELLEHIKIYAKNFGAIFLKTDPAWPAGTAHTLEDIRFHLSRETIQVSETYTIDLTKSAEDILAGMRSKTRQYIRKAEREGAEIIRDQTGTMLDTVYEIYAQTSRRAKFGLHPAQYYKDIFRLYNPSNQYLYIASVNGQPAAFLWMACAGKFAVELYGGVSDSGQEYKSNFLLKWRAIQDMQAAGYTVYDLNGRVNEGISQFKEGFGPDATEWVGSYDLVYNSLLYQGWTRTLPFAKRILAKSDTHSGE